MPLERPRERNGRNGCGRRARRDGAAYDRCPARYGADACAPLVRRGLSRAGANPAETEDVVQDILIAVHLKRHTWDPTRPIGPWISGIARYKIIDNMRRRGFRIELPIEDFAEILPAEEPETASQRDVTRSLEALPEGQRNVVRVDRNRRHVDFGYGAETEHERRRGAGLAASRIGSPGETPS